MEQGNRYRSCHHVEDESPLAQGRSSSYLTVRDRSSIVRHYKHGLYDLSRYLILLEVVVDLTRRSSRYRVHFGSSGPEKQKIIVRSFRCVVKWLNSCRLANRLEHTTQVVSPVLWVKWRVARSTSITFPTSDRGDGYLGKRRYRSLRTLRQIFGVGTRGGILRVGSDSMYLCDTLSSWPWTHTRNYLRYGQLLGRDHPEPLAVEPHLRSQRSVSLRSRTVDDHYHRERRALSRRNHR